MTESVSPPLPQELEPGATFAGKYRIERMLGAGGMGAVFLATHIQLDERVAIKIVLPELVQHDEVVARFLREARATIKIKSEHVARVMDVATTADGTPYMVMEYLEGEDLAQRLERAGPLPIAEAIDAMLQAGEAIAQAHALGIVHRDLKPANLFAARGADGSPSIKVLDFGISKREDAVDSSLTRTHAVMGSPAYMAPEHLRSTRIADARSDIWSLGVVLYELCSGRLPFGAETMAGLAIAIANDTPTQLSAWRSDVPAPLESAVHRCLAKRPTERFQTILELATALAPFGSALGQSALERIRRTPRSPMVSQPEPIVSTTAATLATATSGTWSRRTRALRRPRRMGIGVALAVSVVGLLAAWAVVRDDADSGAPEPAVADTVDVAPAVSSVGSAPSSSATPALSATPPAASVSAPPPAKPVRTPHKPMPQPSAPPSAEPKPSSPFATDRHG